MKEINITAVIVETSFEELTKEEQAIINAAKDATYRSYAPYSNFSVGAAALLSNKTIVVGTNQENAAYPSGICAERTTLFYANSTYPNESVDVLAVAARNGEDFIDIPISPCGACRQVILETENRYSKPIRIYLYGKDKVYIIKSASQLLPLSFSSSFLE